jgi:hypothetical protein
MAENGLVEVALAYFEIGFTVIPMTGKIPKGVTGWQRLYNPRWKKNHQSTEGRLEEWRPQGKPWIRDHFRNAEGIGAVLGWNSGNLYCFDLESAEIYKEFRNHPAMDGSELGELVSRAWTARTPRGGAHVVLRLDSPPPGNTVYARDEDGKVLAESRGQGGVIALPHTVNKATQPAPGVRYWELGPADESGSPTVTGEDFQALQALAKEYNRKFDPVEAAENACIVPKTATSTDSTFDRFNREPSNHQRVLNALGLRGWREFLRKGEGVYLTRPGRERGISASWGVAKRRQDGVPLLKVFSSSTDLPTDRALTPFDAIVQLEFGGDKKALLREIEPTVAIDHPVTAVATKLAQQFAFRRICDVQPEPVKWLVPNFLPAGRLTVVSGRQGSAKSSFVRHVVACLIRGRGIFASTDGAVEVAWMLAEDSPGEQVVPSMVAEGCTKEELGRFYWLDGIGQEEKAPICANDATFMALEQFSDSHPLVKLFIIDPMMDFLAPAGFSPDRQQDVRLSLGRLQKFADRRGASVLVLAHENKNAEAKGQARISGSSQIPATARMVYSVTEYGDRRLVKLIKSNLPIVERNAYLARQVFLLEGEVRELLERYDPHLPLPSDIQGFCCQDIEVVPEDSVREDFQEASSGPELADASSPAKVVFKNKSRNQKAQNAILAALRQKRGWIRWSGICTMLTMEHSSTTLKRAFELLRLPGLDHEPLLRSEMDRSGAWWIAPCDFKGEFNPANVFSR